MADGYDLVATAIGGALGGGIVSVVAQEIVRWWRRPKLTILFENKSGHFAQTPIDWPNNFQNPAAGTTSYQATYVRVKVLNSGRTTARDCRVYLTRVVRDHPDGSKEIIEDQDSAPLNWSMTLSGYQPIDVPVGINQFVDICHTLSRDNPSKLFPTGFFPHRLRTAWAKPGKFEIALLVTANNVEPVKKIISFEWTGPWDSIRYVDIPGPYVGFDP
jgi:hypothetical protein